MVGMGRMQCLGLAADGAAGLVRTLELLEAEVNICLGLLGVNTLKELDSSYLQAVRALEPSGALSAFPLLSTDEKSFY
jgi:glycolate oxidase